MFKLPKWVITDKFPSLYDMESATSIEQTAKLYGTVNDLIDKYNAWVTHIKETIETFINSTEKDYEVFKVALRQEFQDFIDVVDLKLQSQDSEIAEAVDYMKTNLRTSIREMITCARISGELNEDILSCFEDFSEQITAETNARIEADSKLRSDLENETATRETADANLQKAINDEVSARETADANLQKAINDEASARETADANLQKAINDEASARETAIEEETNARSQAIVTLKNQINNEVLTAIQNEATTRGNADTEIINTINTLEKSLQSYNPNIVIATGIARYDYNKAEWYLLNDEGHKPHNMTIESLHSGAFIVHHNVGAKKILYCGATPDETYANNGWVAGASVGLDHSVFNVSALRTYTALISCVNGNYTSDNENITVEELTHTTLGKYLKIHTPDVHGVISLLSLNEYDWKIVGFSSDYINVQPWLNGAKQTLPLADGKTSFYVQKGSTMTPISGHDGHPTASNFWILGIFDTSE